MISVTSGADLAQYDAPPTADDPVLSFSLCLCGDFLNHRQRYPQRAAEDIRERLHDLVVQ